MLRSIVAGLSGLILSDAAAAEIFVFDCRFPNSFSFYITVYDDGSPARIGREQGIGDKAQAYFDEATGAWVVVEFVDDGKLPSTLTTIMRDGVVWHSRHTMSIEGVIVASQQSGTCKRKSIQ